MSAEKLRQEELNLSSDIVVTKYMDAAKILNGALKLVVSECKPKATVAAICEAGDSYIINHTSNIYKKRTVHKGIAFPTCLSVNNTVFSPLATNTLVLEKNDIVKIDMGCHIDGFVAVVAHTHVVTSEPIIGRAADVLAAANTAAEVATKLLANGSKNKDVTEAIQKVATMYNCKVVGDIHIHHLKKSVICGNKFFLSAPNADANADDSKFEKYEAYAIDVTTSTADVRALEKDELDLMEDTSEKFLTYPGFHEKPGVLVAHIKFTVLLMPNGSHRITSHPVQNLQPMRPIKGNPEIHKWLALPTKFKKGGGKRKKGKKRDEATDPLAYLGDEVMYLIFLRLEPIWLFRCSSVCWKWHKVVSSVNFLEFRYEHQQQKPLVMITKNDIGSPPLCKLESFDMESKTTSPVIAFQVKGTVSHCDNLQIETSFKLHGSCKGVLLLSFQYNLYLCNPTTRHWAPLPYSLTNGDMLCLYYHKGTGAYRLLKQECGRTITSSSYSVIELNYENKQESGRLMTPSSYNFLELNYENYGLEQRHRHICERGLDYVEDPAPVQVNDYVYWVRRDDTISVFDTISETFDSIPSPPFPPSTEGRVRHSIELLEINGQLAASISWGDAATKTREAGPAYVDLWIWTYKHNIWEFSLTAVLPVDVLRRRYDTVVHFLRLKNAYWTAQICDQSGHTLVCNLRDLVFCDRSGNILNTFHPKDITMNSRLMLKEDLFPHRMLHYVYDVPNLKPSFIEHLTRNCGIQADQKPGSGDKDAGGSGQMG